MNYKNIPPTTYANPFTIEDLQRLIDYVPDNLPPIATEIHVSLEGYNVIMKNVSILDDFRREELSKEHGYMSVVSGVKIIVKEYGEMFVNQAKVIYSDGSSKVIDIYERSIKEPMISPNTNILKPQQKELTLDDLNINYNYIKEEH